MVPSDFLAVNEYSDLAVAETNARGHPVAASGATRSALADATAPISITRSIGLRVREITSSVQYSSRTIQFRVPVLLSCFVALRAPSDLQFLNNGKPNFIKCQRIVLKRKWRALRRVCRFEYELYDLI